jgi:hypothetical protein
MGKNKMIKLLEILKEINLEEQSRANLYHGLKFKYAIPALKANKLDAYTFQRFWPDGKRRKDDDPEYQNSYYYRGLSLTRDPKYASGWSHVIFEFNQDALKTKYKIIPYNWGYSIGKGYEQGSRVKHEREEFLITSTIDRPLTNSQLSQILKKPGGSVEPLNKFLEGIYLSKRVYDIYTDNDTKKYEPIENIKSNPLYKGLL